MVLRCSDLIIKLLSLSPPSPLSNIYSVYLTQIFCLSKSVPQLPLQIEDAMRPEQQDVCITISIGGYIANRSR